MSTLPTDQVPTIYHRRVGDILVTTICDGYIEAAPEALKNITPDESASLLAQAFQPPRPRITVNAFLVRTGDRTVLIEAGSGHSLGPTLGWIPANLAAAGVDPQEIDTILLTHMHPDHSNGLIAADGSVLFPNAELLMHEAEPAYWRDDACRSAADERRRMYFDTARQRLDAYAKQLRTFRDGEVAPRIEAMPIPGHTPGHTGYRISSGADTLLIWGDIVHVPQVQIPRPEVGIVFDVDTDAAIATRRRVLDMVAADRLLVAGMHLNFPGYAHVTRSSTSFALVPEIYRLEP